MDDRFAIEIQGLEKCYDGGVEALKGIDLTVKEGDFFALLGPNGAGKSTTIGILSSLVKKTGGKVSIFGHDIDTQFSEAKQCLGLVPQEVNFNQFEKVIDIVINQAGYYGVKRAEAKVRAEDALKRLDLWDKRDTQSRRLSGGMKRRLMIARALVHNPKLLVLDEPTAGVDIELRRSMWTFLQDINKAGTTIVLTTHYLEEAENLCRNIAIINNGEIVKNTSVRDLLAELNRETFILDVSLPLTASPDLPAYNLSLVDSNTLEVELEKGASMNALFSALSSKDINVISMRNKVNRLEELFVNLISAHETQANEETEDKV